MLKLWVRRFAPAACAGAAMLASGVAVAQQPGITPGDSQPAPRRNEVRSGRTVPELDSRTGGGEFARDVNDRGAAVGDDLHERTAFAGIVTGVSDGRLAVQMVPPRVPVAMEQVFKVTDTTPVVVDGERGTLADIKKDSVVRVITYAGDPETAAKVVAVSPRGAKTTTAAPERPTNKGVPSTPAVARAPAEATSGVNVWPNKDAPRTNRADVDPPRDIRGVVTTQTTLRPITDGQTVLGLGIEVYDSPGEGVLVTDVLPDGPAALSGVLVGDFIMRVNGEPVLNPAGLSEGVAQVKGQGGQVALTLWRNGEVSEVAVSPVAAARGRMTTAASLRDTLITRREATAAPLLGLTLRDHERSGVIVAGLNGTNDIAVQRGDVILSVNGQPVDNRADLTREMQLLGQNGGTNGTVPVVVRRGDQYLTLDVPVQSAAATSGAAAETTTGAAARTTETTTTRSATGTRAAVTGTTDAPGTANGAARRADAAVRSGNAPAGTGPAATRPSTGTRRATSNAAVGRTPATDTGTTGTGPAGSAEPAAGGETNEKGQRTQGVTTPGPGPQ